MSIKTLIFKYDQIAATKEEFNLSTSVPTAEDIAIIKNRENVGKFYISRNDDLSIDKNNPPIRGYGLWGTFLAIYL